MKFSVIGLPHYTIWHLYEPSVDDLRHMEEMEQERLAREQEEKERADQKDTTQAKSQSQSSDHIVDAESKHGSAEGSVARPGKDSQDVSSDKADQAEKVEKIKSGKI